MFTDTLLALALLLTTASQLRISGSPVGPGELVLVLWVSFVGMRSLLLGQIRMSPALGRLLIFWLLFTISLGVGTIVALATHENFDPQWFLHDTMAYPLLAVVSCLTLADSRTRVDRVAWLVVILGSVSFTILVAGSVGLVPLPFDPWFWERFRGWSQNPNQLSVLAGILALVCVYLVNASTRLGARIVALLCMTLIVYIGLLTQSDTFKLALIVAVPSFVFLKLRERIKMASVGLRQAPFAMIAIAGLLGLSVSVVPLLLKEFGASDVISIVSKNGGKEASHEADLRKSLWTEALERGFYDAGMLGLGPGPHLMIPTEIALAHLQTEGAPANTTHPEADGDANFEAHNTFLDLFTQGGLLAAGSFIWLMAAAYRQAFRTISSSLIALLLGMSIFCFTGNVIRLPVVWFALTLCLVGERQRQVDTTRVQRGAAYQHSRQLKFG